MNEEEPEYIQPVQEDEPYEPEGPEYTPVVEEKGQDGQEYTPVGEEEGQAFINDEATQAFIDDAGNGNKSMYEIFELLDKDVNDQLNDEQKLKLYFGLHLRQQYNSEEFQNVRPGEFDKAVVEAVNTMEQERAAKFAYKPSGGVVRSTAPSSATAPRVGYKPSGAALSTGQGGGKRRTRKSKRPRKSRRTRRFRRTRRNRKSRRNKRTRRH